MKSTKTRVSVTRLVFVLLCFSSTRRNRTEAQLRIDLMRSVVCEDRRMAMMISCCSNLQRYIDVVDAILYRLFNNGFVPSRKQSGAQTPARVCLDRARPFPLRLDAPSRVCKAQSVDSALTSHSVCQITRTRRRRAAVLQRSITVCRRTLRCRRTTASVLHLVWKKTAG